MKKFFINLASYSSNFVIGLLVAFSYYFLYWAGAFNIQIDQLLRFLVIGIITGLIYVLLGIVLFRNCYVWRNSMEYLEKMALTKGSIYFLFAVSLLAGLLEEAYTRGLILYIYLVTSVSSGTNISKLIIYALVLNLLWTIHHVFNDKDNLINRPLYAIKQATPHMIIIFLSGIPWYFITLGTGSLIPAIISHFLLDFGIGIFYRKQLINDNLYAQ